MARESIQYVMSRTALENITNDNTARAYKHDIKEFACWARSMGYKKIEDITAGDARKVVQLYRDEVLLKKTRSPATEHRKVAAVCKGLGLQRPKSRNDLGWDGRIITTARTAGTITRGRRMDANQQGKQEIFLKKNERLVQFQSVVGIRRAELGRLRGRDLVRDESGKLSINIERGKGGKRQLQRILPQDENIVIKTFAGILPDQKVFSPKELQNHINLHGMRAAQAQRAYGYYAEKYQTSADRETLARELMKRYDRYHPDGRGRAKFAKELEKGVQNDTYLLRGENKEKAIRLGLPVKYDRLALMATSVFHLSHWRLSIAAVNYIVQ